MPALSAMSWVGGKSDGMGNQQRTGAWIASLLPQDTDVTYCEPFAGMLGVLLQRPQAAMEIVNDLDGRVVNWWRVVRDQPGALSRLIALTPNSRDEYARARASIAEGGEGIHAALDFTICIMQGMASSPGNTGWRQHYQPRGSLAWRRGLDDRIAALAERMRDVAIDNRPAEELIERMASVDEAVIYVDPPYPTAAQGLYGVDTLDHARLSEGLKALTGRAAISGYGDEWDHLGWQRHERSTLRVTPGRNADARVEVLWTNYEPPHRLL